MKRLTAAGYPIVLVDRYLRGVATDYVISDHFGGAMQVMQHLIGLGHRRIGYLGYAHSGRTNLKRLSGYREAMQAAGLPVPDGYEFEAEASTPWEGQSAIQHFLALPQMPTALFCYNDMLAIGALHGLQAAGLRVPQDCSVAGFDNIPFSSYTNPPLTTFDQPKRTIGEQAARLVLGLLDQSREGTPEPQIQTLQGGLLVRASTGRPDEEKR